MARFGLKAAVADRYLLRKMLDAGHCGLPFRGAGVNNEHYVIAVRDGGNRHINALKGSATKSVHEIGFELLQETLCLVERAQRLGSDSRDRRLILFGELGRASAGQRFRERDRAPHGYAAHLVGAQKFDESICPFLGYGFHSRLVRKGIKWSDLVVGGDRLRDWFLRVALHSPGRSLAVPPCGANRWIVVATAAFPASLCNVSSAPGASCGVKAVVPAGRSPVSGSCDQTRRLFLGGPAAQYAGVHLEFDRCIPGYTSLRGPGAERTLSESA